MRFDLAIQVKEFTKDFVLLAGMSFFTQLWNEFNGAWVAHLIALIIAAVIVRIIGKWISEHIDEMSDLEFTQIFVAGRDKFDRLKNIETHGTLYKPNLSSSIFDGNKIRIVSKFAFIKSVEIFELIVTENKITLSNIRGKYESSVSYEYDGFVIIATWVSKPKGVYRAITLFFSGMAKRQVTRDFNTYLDKKEGE